MTGCAVTHKETMQQKRKLMTDCKYFTIEAYYVTPVLESYNGHVLADHFSSIQEVDCK